MPVTVAWISGAAGFVAPHLTELLEAEGMDVYGFDIAFGQDLLDYSKVRSSIEHAMPDYIFHLAAQAYVPESSTDPRRGFEVNVMGTLNVLEAVRHTGCPARVLVASSSEVYGYDHAGILTENTPCWPTTPYGVTKLAAEQLGLTYNRLYGMPVVSTRAFNHTGPGHAPVYAIPSFAKRVAEVEAGKRKTVLHGNLSAKRSYADVRDVVRAYRLAIDLPSGVYNICSDVVVDMQQVLDMLCELADGDIPTEVDDKLYRAGSGEFPQPSCDKFKEATGWRAAIPLRDTLESVLHYWRENL